MMDALYLILHIEGGLGLFTTTYDGRLVFNSTYREIILHIEGAYLQLPMMDALYFSTYRGRFGLIYNYL